MISLKDLNLKLDMRARAWQQNKDLVGYFITKSTMKFTIPPRGSRSVYGTHDMIICVEKDYWSSAKKDYYAVSFSAASAKKFIKDNPTITIDEIVYRFVDVDHYHHRNRKAIVLEPI